jgi:hypothetical protein
MVLEMRNKTMTTKTRQYALDAAVEVAKLFNTGYMNLETVEVIADRIDDHMLLLVNDLTEFMMAEHNAKALKLFEDQAELYAKQFETDVNKLRDQIAITAMNGLLIGEPDFHTDLGNEAATAENAYVLANAMLEERKKYL